MSDHGTWDAVAAEASAFEQLLADAVCPPPGVMLLAITAELRQFDPAPVSFRLDELARELFDTAAQDDPGAASHRLAALLTDDLRLRTDEASADGMWPDRVLARRAGHPLALAVLAAEIGRRAGLQVGVCSTPTGWYAGIGGRERLWLIDPALDPGPTPSGQIRRHCGHEVGFAALTGIYARMIRDGEGGRACHAAHLRGRLPVGRHS
jgi:regulator of sirC expression with transglutaminase-like and TPR domain